MNPAEPEPPQGLTDPSKVSLVDHLLIRDRVTGDVLLSKRGSMKRLPHEPLDPSR